MWRRKWFIPAALAVFGVLLVTSGIAWGVVTGVAVPDQDPTPAMREHARLHTLIVDCALLGGVVALVMSVASVPVVLLAAVVRNRSRR